MGKKGFLLFEVMMSIVVVAAGLIFITRIYSVSGNSIRRSEDALRASLLLEERMFEFDAKGEIGEGAISGDFEEAKGYSWRTNAERLENSEIDLVTMDVFRNKNPKDTSYSVHTYIRNKER